MKKMRKRMLPVSLAAVLAVTSLGGCAGKGDGAGENSSTSGGQAMGRYLEEEVALPEGMEAALDITQLRDGKIRVLGCDMEMAYKVWDSADGGTTWEEKGELTDDTEGEEVYLLHAALSPAGEAFATGYKGEEQKYFYMTGQAQFQEVNLEMGELDGSFGTTGGVVTEGLDAVDVDPETETETGNGGEDAETEAGDESENAESEAASEGEEAFFTDYNVEMVNGLADVAYAPDGTLFGNDYNSKLYKIHPSTGELEEFLSDVSSFEIAGDMLIAGIGGNMALYDTAAGEPVPQDQVLLDAIKQAGGIEIYSSSGKQVLFADGLEDNCFYYCSREGVFRHISGGSVNEQIVDGNLNSLGSPDIGLAAMIVLENGEFLVLANQGMGNGSSKLLKYSWSEDTPSKPSKELKLYSLRDNTDIRQAISLFQKENADYYINFQTGIDGEDGATVSDALKTLNADIMAGKGPDILVLDGLPIASYMEKGLLADLSDVLDELKTGDGCFENVAETYRNESGLYGIPSRFSIPAIAGNEELVKAADDIRVFADKAEKLRKEDKDVEAIVNTASPELTAEKFYQSYSPALLNEDGTLNQENVKEFYTQLKRISSTGKYSQEVEERVVYTISSTGAGIWGGVDTDSMDVLGGGLKAAAGTLSSVSAFNEMLAVNNKLNQEYALWNLAGKKVYCPQTVFGVSSKSTMPEDAKKFVSYVLKKDPQKLDQGGGFPINRKAFDAATIEVEDMPEMSICHSNQQTGEMVELKISWPKKEEFDALREKIESLDTPTLVDEVIKEAVIEQAVKYMKDECSVEDAVAALVQKVNLYLAE